MNKVSVLEDGVWELEKLRDKLGALDQYKAKLESLDREEQTTEQEIQKKDADINNEITEVISKRESEIAKSYDEQIERQKNKVRKVEEDKKKNKDKKVKERIRLETASLCEENEKISEEASYVFRQNKVAKIYNTRFYYAMFTPKGIGDFLIDLLFVFVVFAMIPCGSYLIMNPTNAAAFWIVTYGIVCFVTAVLYYIAYHATKLKAPDAIQKGKELMYQIRKNNRAIKKIKRGIVKDKDESIYHLDSYNKELQKLEKKLREIEVEKKEALLTLKNTTSNILANEVRTKYEAEVTSLQQRYETQKEEIHHMEETIRDITFELTNNYQAYLGADMMNVAAVDELIAIMNESEFRAVSEALPLYRLRKMESNNDESKSVS